MFTLTDEQDYVASEAVKWFLYGNQQVFQYAAPPGAGKSVVLNEIIMRLGLLRVEAVIYPRLSALNR